MITLTKDACVEAKLPSISVVIPTRDRLEDLSSLLRTLLHQVYPPKEVIIVDDSPSRSAREMGLFFYPQFISIGCSLKLVASSAEGLTRARNLGIKASQSDAVFFTDDDTELSPEVLLIVATFFKETPAALGIQPKIVTTEPFKGRSIIENLTNALYKVFMQNYFKKDTLTVQRSGFSVFPIEITRVFSAKRLSGSCCYRREVFSEINFDINLKRWGFMEDLDFSYRLYKKHPESLFVIPRTQILHKTSLSARLPNKLSIQMKTVYWFYVFFKDVFDGSVKNLLAFMWALAGNLSLTVLSLVSKRKNKPAWWTLIHLLGSYKLAFKNLDRLLSGQLDFFNSKLKSA